MLIRGHVDLPLTSYIYIHKRTEDNTVYTRRRVILAEYLEHDQQIANGNSVGMKCW